MGSRYSIISTAIGLSSVSAVQKTEIERPELAACIAAPGDRVLRDDLESRLFVGRLENPYAGVDRPPVAPAITKEPSSNNPSSHSK